MRVLGIWDGHDAGAAIVEDNRIRVAVNEERYTTKKLDVGFPTESVKACLDYLKLKPSDINNVAITTTDFAKTLTRVFPSMKDSYYMFRRRRIERPNFIELRRQIKYRTTEIPELPLCRSTSERFFRKHLDRLGFKEYKIKVVEHHMAHAAKAAVCSGFRKALVITLDGIGDGLSGSVNIFEDGDFKRIASIPGRDSFGIFYEQVTNLLGWRELEDEGKVMALADFSYPIPDEENKLLDFFEVNGMRVKCRHSTIGKYKMLNRILWNTPREDFAYMAQRTLEKHVCQLFENAVDETGLGNVAWSGGLASNIKVNLKVRENPKVKDWFVFPHMGDGGLAVGAALYVCSQETGYKPKRIENVYFGPEYGEDEMESALKKSRLEYEERGDIAEYCGQLIAEGNHLLWYQGGMEFGPRALGNRSILASASSLDAKEKLNLKIKKRNWFQPFCPSLLEEEAEKLFENVDHYDRFMTMGYMSKKEVRDRVAAVINVDGSARPQMLGGENPKYRKLIEEVKRLTGDGIILNTSFNLHGFPIVNRPADAVDMMLKSGAERMALGDFFVVNR
ncbi:MAG: carbamoyltransferase C-terminal domain-containing protein [Candidatus Altiarchaeota archaeon]